VESKAKGVDNMGAGETKWFLRIQPTSGLPKIGVWGAVLQLFVRYRSLAKKMNLLGLSFVAEIPKVALRFPDISPTKF
jgi:hypothetical protein